MDKINNKWGEFVITPALMMGMDDIILDRISFGGVKGRFCRKIAFSRVLASVSH
jgi:hypothetical protein